MATTISKLAILLSLNSGGVTSGLTSAEDRIRKFEKRVDGLGSKSFAMLGRAGASAMSSIAGGITAAVAAAVSLQHILSETGEAYERVALRSKRASQLGSNAQELGALEFAFGQGTQINSDGTFDALRAFNKRISDAKDPANELAKALDRIGLSAQRLESQTVVDRVRTIGEAIRQLPAAEDRAAVAAKFFEETGSNIVALFNEGDGAFRSLLADYDRVHGKLTETDIDGMRQASASLDRLWISIEGSFERLAAELGPTFAANVDQLTEAVVEMRETFEWFADSGIPDLMADLWWFSGKINPGIAPIAWMLEQTPTSPALPGLPSLPNVEAVAERTQKIADDSERAADAWVKIAESNAKALESEANRLIDGLMTPLERFDKEMERIFYLFGSGSLNDDFFNRAIASAEEKLRSATERSEKVAKRDMNLSAGGLAERGSVAAFSAERAGRNELKTLADNSTKALVLDQKMVEAMEELNRQYRETGEIKLVFEPIL